MGSHPADGSLQSWAEIADRGWDALLIGNGLSINLSPAFAYESLYEEAEKDSSPESLTDQDLAVFERFGTSHFEVVLGKLREAIAMASVLGEDEAPYRRRFRSVQTALGAAVRSVHLERRSVPDASLWAIKEALNEYRAIFSTSYDLIVYWAIGHGEEYWDFCDSFWGGRAEFDPSDADVWPGKKPVYYVHGALHLIVEGSGMTRKLICDDSTLLDQFGAPIAGDPEARPLLISEGSARDKLKAIEANDYLAHAYERLAKRSRPLVVFGHSLGEQDRHLIEAINASPRRPIAVSMVAAEKRALRERQADIWGKLETDEVYFYDAATHPLGSPELGTNKPRVRFRRQPLKRGSVRERA